MIGTRAANEAEKGLVVKMERLWAMPSHKTFQISPIARLLDEEGAGNGIWVDPFAGSASLATITNDLNPDTSAQSHQDALVFLSELPSDFADGVLFDPPYSITQAAEMYANFGAEKLSYHPSNMGYWAAVKDQLARILKVGGTAICFGWSSMGLGKSRNFVLQRVLLVPHGGSKNDTIVTVETKLDKQGD